MSPSQLFKVFLVDDEILITEGLKIITSWDAYGFKIAGTFIDGDEAVEAALKVKPDVIITDIRMPGCSGLELVQNLKDKLPGTKFIILSGYDDFKYAQTALQYGANDYILKPVGVEKIQELLKRLYLQLKEEQSKKKLNEERDIQLKGSREKLAGTNIFSCIKHKDAFVFREVRDDYKHLNRECIFALVKVDKYLLSLNEYGYTAVRVAEARKKILGLSDADFVFEVEEGLFALIFKCDVEVGGLFKQLMQSVNDRSECVSISYAAFDNFFDNVHDSYLRVIEILNSRIFEGKNKIYKSAAHTSLHNNIDLQVFFEKINKALLNGQYEMIEAAVNELFNMVKICKHPDIPGIRRIAMEIYMSVKDFLQNEFRISIGDVLKEDILKCNILEQLEVSDDFKEWLKLFFERVISYFVEKMPSNRGDIINRIKFYIQKHYSEEISLQSVSKAFNINPSYLSQLFKKSTGDNFVNYVNQIRIERAKLLLESSSLNINEIGDKVGFNNEKYFIKVFGKYVNMTPTNYKKHHIQSLSGL